MTDPILRLFIGTPSYGEKVCSRQTRMWLELGSSLSDSSERFQLAGMLDVDTQPIDRVRNLIVEAAQKAGADWLLMIDSDVWCTGNDLDESAGFQILRMISQADREGAIVVGANVHRRGGEGLMTYVESTSTGRMLSIDPRTRADLSPVDAIGTSLIAIRVQVLPKHCRFAFADGLSEDLYFCKQVREHYTRDHVAMIANPIFVDNRVHTGHMGRPRPVNYP